MKPERRLITIQTNNGPEQVLAETLGLLAVHPAQVRDGYAITHLPTGWCLGLLWVISREQALALMELLQPLEWGFAETRIPESTREAARKIIWDYVKPRMSAQVA